MFYLDNTCRAITSANPSMLVPWFLMASYAYYEKDDPILSDGLYDEMAQELLAKWSKVKHPHKEVIDKGLLSAGSFMLKRGCKYPSLTKHAAERLIEDVAYVRKVVER